MKIGILIKSFGNNQTALTITDAVNRFCVNNYEHDVTIFFEEINKRLSKPLCSIMNISELWNFSGELIFTDVTQHHFIKNVPQKINTTFYVQNLDWLTNLNYEYNYEVFKGNVIARSESHADAIERFCGKRPMVISKFNLHGIYSI